MDNATETLKLSWIRDALRNLDKVIESPFITKDDERFIRQTISVLEARMNAVRPNFDPCRTSEKHINIVSFSASDMAKVDFVVNKVIEAMYANKTNPGSGKYREDGESLYNDHALQKQIQKRLEDMGFTVHISGMGAGYNKVGSDRNGFYIEKSHIEIWASSRELADRLTKENKKYLNKANNNQALLK
jgi:hypothetical protein